MDLDWCLVCDKRTQGGLYCSPACRQLEQLSRAAAAQAANRSRTTRSSDRAEGPDTPPPILRRGRAGSFNAWPAVETALAGSAEAHPFAERATKSFGHLPPSKPSPPRKTISFSFADDVREPVGLPLGAKPATSNKVVPEGLSARMRASMLHASLVADSELGDTDELFDDSDMASSADEDPDYEQPMPILAPVPHSPPRASTTPRGSSNPRNKRFVELLEKVVGGADLSSTPHWTGSASHAESPDLKELADHPPLPTYSAFSPNHAPGWIADSPNPFEHEYAVSAPAMLMRGWRVVTPPIVAHSEEDEEDEEDVEVEGKPTAVHPVQAKDGVDRVLSVLRSILLLDGPKAP